MKKIFFLFSIVVLSVLFYLIFIYSNIHVLKPGKGVDSFKIGKSASGEPPEELLLFPDENGKIEMIYTESKNYKIKVKGYAIKVGERFKDLNLDVKQSLDADTGTSDKLRGVWYISPHGYLISVEGGVIKGIGVSPLSIENHTK